MNFWIDLKYAWRLARKSWGYSLMCASVVALSVGLAVWTYVVAYNELLKPLGFPGSERWYSVQIAADATAKGRPAVDAYTLQEMLARSRSADHLGSFVSREAVLSEGQASTSLRAAAISPRLLAATRVPPHLGRVLEEADGRPGAPAVAILSFDTWQSYFAADPAVVGRTARIDSALVRIVGVMPKGFRAFQDFELWVPLQMTQVARPRDSATILSPIIVLHEGQNLDVVSKELNAAVGSVNRDYPEQFNAARRAVLIPALRMFTHSEATIMAVVSLLAASVLLLGCVNISMVFLARLLERSRELALRTALGASRARLLRQCLMEGALVVPLGLVAGYGLAVLLTRWLVGVMRFAAQVSAAGQPNEPVLRPVDMAAAVACAIFIWLLSTLIPAWRITKQDAAAVLAGSGKGTAVRGGNRSAAVLVGLQVITSSLVLAICANVVLAVRTEVNKPTGINSDRVMIATYPTVFNDRYTEPAQRLRYWENLSEAIESRVPGAEVAFASAVPTRAVRIPASIETQQGTEGQGTFKLPLAVVSDGYFKLMGLSLRTGRQFDSTDSHTSLKVAVVDEILASRYWPDQDALGKRVQLNPAENGTWLTIVGIVSAVGGRPYASDVGVLYQPMRQAVPPQFLPLVRLPSAVAGSRTELRAAAYSVDRDLPLHNLQTLDDYRAVLNLQFTTLMQAFVAAAIMTAILAAFGLYGLISRSVAQRTQEVGIRRALGATSWRATSMFIRQGTLYLSVAVVGVALAIIVMNVLSRVITNVFDHVILVTLGVVFLLGVVILAASSLTSRRALVLEPGDALRYE